MTSIEIETNPPMKTRLTLPLIHRNALLLLIVALNSHLPAWGQGTVFSYQGRLDANGVPVTGDYDFRFYLRDAFTGGNPVSTTNTLAPVGVSNGLFSVTLDFGNNPFSTGAPRWLEIGVRPTGSGAAYSTLSPRQALSATPYALTASNLTGTLPASQLSGALSSAQFSGNYASAVTLNNPANSFSGNGGGLTNVNATRLGGLVSSNFWQLGGNNIAANHFFGSTNNQALELRVNGQRALRLEPTPNDASDSNIVNIVSGSLANSIGGVRGATISGGGAEMYEGDSGPNIVQSDFGTIGGGLNNNSGGFAATIGGGFRNSTFGETATVGGGFANKSDGPYATVAGGIANWSLAESGTVGGGWLNHIPGPGVGGTIAGGKYNTALGVYGTVGGGAYNTSGAPATIAATVSGGEGNTSTGSFATVGGGATNMCSADGAVIAGGLYNRNLTMWASVGGGYQNLITGNSMAATIGGGYNNTINANGYAATIGGGYQNNSTAFYSTVGGGHANGASGSFATVVGGAENIASGDFATVGGGDANTASGKLSFAAGYRARATDQGSFVWADSQAADFTSTTSNQFNIRAAGGVRLNPDTSLFWGSGARLWSNQGGSIELGDSLAGAGASIPYIDFHYGKGLAQDFNVRLINDADQQLTCSGNLAFGAATRQMLNLWGSVYGIGVQASTMYFRTDNDSGFAWYSGGTHSDSTLDSGGGKQLMRLSSTALYVNGVFASASDRNLKSGFEAVDSKSILEQLAALPISRWHYTNDVATMHLGPVAQDFYAAFHIGADDKHIATVDADGVALAAIQGLNQKLVEKDTEIEALKRRLERLERMLSEPPTTARDDTKPIHPR